MAWRKQRAAARKNIGKAIVAAKKKRTISHLSTKTRTALGKERSKSGKVKTTAHHVQFSPTIPAEF
jgi:hypothetical protein